jgi:hypothetical protein
VLDNGSAPATVQPGCELKIVRELAKSLAEAVEHHLAPGHEINPDLSVVLRAARDRSRTNSTIDRSRGTA